MSDTVDRSEKDVRERNKGAGGMHASLFLLQEMGCDVQFNIPCEQELRVTRDGLTYTVQQYGRIGKGIRYCVGMDIDGSHPVSSWGNSFESYARAVSCVYEMVRTDPRQDIPAKHRATHFTVSVPVK